MKHLSTISLFSILFFFSSLVYSQSTKNQLNYVEGEYIIQLESQASIHEIIQKAPISFNLQIKKLLSEPMRIWLLQFDHTTINHESVELWLNQQTSITFTELNRYVYMRSTLPGDPSISDQWHHNNTGQTGGTADADIDSDLAWDITTGGKTATNDDIVVCMIEGAGGNLDHQDLSPNRWINTGEIENNGIDDDNNGYVDDYNGWNISSNNDDYGTGGHGTNCLGMIGAKGDNNLNVVGANWDVKLMVVYMGGLTESSVIEAYTYPLVMRKRWNETNGAEGAFVVSTSASWGIDGADPTDYPLWCNFYDTLGHYGILNVGATTNQNLDVDVEGDMPTACSSNYMIGVGRTDHNDNTAGGYGATTIDLGSPGINVVTTDGSNGITTTTGTSFACPLTAGVIGLAYAIPCPNFMTIVKSDPQYGADLVLEAILSGVDAKTQLASKFITGGRLNARNTLDSLMETTCSSCVSQNIQSTSDSTNATITFDSNAEVNAVNIYWREVGASTWNSDLNIASPYALSNLIACSNYEFYLENSCTSETNDSQLETFSTTGCGNCVDLSYCSSTATGSNDARVALFSPSSVETTILNFTETAGWGAAINSLYVAGNFVLMNSGGTNPNEGCDPVSNASEINGNIAVAVRGTCNFSAKALNAQNAGAVGLLIINNQGNAPFSLGAGTGAGSITIPVIMISQTDGADLLNALTNNEVVTGLMGVQHEWIESFGINSITNVSGDNNGYLAVGTTSPILLEQGDEYSIEIQPGYANQAIPEYTRIWLDANQNGTFDANELIFDQGSASTGSVNGNITIPVNATTGSTRLRVQMAFMGVGQTNLPNECGDFNWGEVEDYCVSITPSDGVFNGIESASKNTIQVYPNPTNQFINFKFEHFHLFSSIRIVDVVGKEMLWSAIDNPNLQIDVSSFAKGTYFYQILSKNGNNEKIGKLIVK